MLRRWTIRRLSEFARWLAGGDQCYPDPDRPGKLAHVLVGLGACACGELQRQRTESAEVFRRFREWEAGQKC